MTAENPAFCSVSCSFNSLRALDVNEPRFNCQLND
jgi:hypothetical protein